MTSVQEFITSDQYLGALTINVNLPKKLDLDQLQAKEKLQLLETVLIRISENMRRNYQKYRGTYRFISRPLKEVITDYSVHVDPTMIVNQKLPQKRPLVRSGMSMIKRL